MKVLVIGGTRFFGKRLVQLLIEAGHQVTILTRGLTRDEFGDKIYRLKANRTDFQQLEKVLNEDYDVVIDNLAMSAKDINDMIFLLKDKIGHYVLTSTLSVYDQRPGALIENDFLANDLYFENTYQAGKRSAEYALSLAPFSYSVMRIPIIVGPDDYTKRLLMHIQASVNDKKLFFPNPSAHFSYLHAKDAARALLWLAEEKKSGVFNISSTDAWTIRELMRQIDLVTGKTFNFGGPNDEPSPFGINDDYYMDVSKAKKAGFNLDTLETWMPRLMAELAFT